MHQFQDVNQAQVANQAQSINQALTQLERLEGNQSDGLLAKQQNQNLSDINTGKQKDADISAYGGKQGMKRRDSKKIKKKQPGDHERPNTEGGHKEVDSGLEESEIDGNEQEQKDEISSSASSCTYASSNTESSCMHTFIDDDEKFKSAKSDLGASINDSRKAKQIIEQKAYAIADLDLQMEMETDEEGNKLNASVQKSEHLAAETVAEEISTKIVEIAEMEQKMSALDAKMVDMIHKSSESLNKVQVEGKKSEAQEISAKILEIAEMEQKMTALDAKMVDMIHKSSESLNKVQVEEKKSEASLVMDELYDIEPGTLTINQGSNLSPQDFELHGLQVRRKS